MARAIGTMGSVFGRLRASSSLLPALTAGEVSLEMSVGGEPVLVTAYIDALQRCESLGEQTVIVVVTPYDRCYVK
jgi:hypothetical protein